MDMNGIYQKDNKFDGEESLYYVLAGNGGSSRLSKNEKYHIITCSAVAIYDINADCVVTWKKPLAVARDFVEHIVSRDEAFREYIAADEALYDAALECLEDYEDECEIHFSTPEEFANALKERMKYIFVNQNGSYTIGYDDGYVFGGHEIDVDVDSKGKMVCADMR